MKRIAVLLCFACTFVPSVRTEAAITIRSLPLPRAATIDPFGARSLMAAATDGTVAATLTLHGYAQRVVIWKPNGSYRMLPGTAAIAAFDSSGALLVNAGHPLRIASPWQVTPMDFSSCESFPQTTTGPIVAGPLSNGAMISTMLSPSIVDLDDASGQRAPVVLYLRSNQCLNMGNGIALASDGLYYAGYIAYIADVPAPSNVVSAKERFVAMRWHERTREPLGTGVAIAVNAAGTTAGADAPPGSTAYNRSVHAMLWQSDGSSVALAPESPLSVAYAVDERDRVTGMLEDAQQHHYAFLWINGTLHRLDDLVHAPDWRFECGYAFTSDGSLIGIGTYRGTPTGFEIKSL